MFNEANYLNIVTNLIDWPVIENQSEKRIGEIIDVAIHPTEGELTGIVIKTDAGEKAALRADAFQIHLPLKKVYANRSSLLPGSEIKEIFKKSVTIYKGLLGCEVMTRQGELLGRILSVYINLSGRRVFYRVFTSWAAVFETASMKPISPITSLRILRRTRYAQKEDFARCTDSWIITLTVDGRRARSAA